VCGPASTPRMVYCPRSLVSAPIAVFTTLTCADAIGCPVAASVTRPVMVPCADNAPAGHTTNAPRSAARRSERRMERVLIKTSLRVRGWETL